MMHIQHLKFIQSTTQILHTQNQIIHTSISAVNSKQCCKISRRDLTIFTNSSLLLLTAQTLHPYSRLDARAEENPVPPQENTQDSDGEFSGVQAEENPLQAEENTQDTTGEVSDVQAEENPLDNKGENEQKVAETSPNKDQTKRAFLDISIDGKPIGRIVIGLYDEKVPVGAARFSDLVSGKAGITYRRKEFVKIMPNYVQHGGIRSYGVDAELANRTGKSLSNDTLVGEWERENEEVPGTKNLAGTVSIIVRDPTKPPPKMKLVARQGKLQIDQEEVGIEPNGTEFTIAIKDSPELDSSALVVGKVIEGMDVVEKVAQVKTVQENTSSPYFRVAKLIGDKRAVVAERGFNRPYSKVIITNCGLLE
ncbi:peptidyl-prolyl cis-trans isomerase CYP26-2, chloroplastic [Amaranthus tricolor]|uniref:peptidyl-prolyl cis-trans isomerase CYP26-2, chloroplastic n=1 Tax=Amaranthus tricolor TaxID=29722 RepID=UPI00258A4D78|nr:peptidyl-prolyl cis-trans isomerase CYP26-2, chloroplastic [Amaranthus tricolor]